MTRHLLAATGPALEYCKTCGWWTRPRCGH